MKEERESKWPSWLPIRSELSDLIPYGAPQISGVIALNTNENPFPLPSAVVEQVLNVLPKVLENLNRYPDRDANELRGELAKYVTKISKVAISDKNIWAANGSNEILQTLFLACGGRGALGFLPSYSVHPLIAKTTGVRWIGAEREGNFELNLGEAITQIASERPGLTFLTTPNNPTGNITGIDDLEKLAIATRAVDGLLVVDEAYAEFSSEPSAVTLIASYPNVVVVRTMSKAFAFAGVRVGYAVCDPSVVLAMLVTRLPYHLSSPTQALALVALANSELLLAEVSAIVLERERVRMELTEMGFKVSPSSANFLLFAGFKKSAKITWEELVASGILIRDVGLEGFLRVTIGLPVENEKFLTAIDRYRP
jgi:histidinol-phosphate aminotransferase